MKKILFVTLSLVLSVTTFAQQQLASLNHNDSVSVFYGPTALKQACDSAANGDVILLSSGVFNSITISKSVTIRGNGMVRDTISGTEPTIINGCTFSHNDIVMEGVRIANITYFESTNYISFIKCMIDQIGNNGMYGRQNITFLNCIIRNYYMFPYNNCQFVNSIIYFEYWSNSYGCSLRNCVAILDPTVLTKSSQNVPAVTCMNSVLVSTSSNSPSVNPLATFNCVGISNNDYFSNTANGNQNISSLDSVFKYFGGLQQSYMPLVTDFDLQDSIAANVLGDDGTQVGVYGGMAPFTPRVNTPRFVKCNVAPHTTPDGKLSVDVEVVSE